MGDSKKGGYPPGIPVTHYVPIQNGKAADITVAWGDKVVFQNEDDAVYVIVGLTDSNPDPAKIMGIVTAKGTASENSSEIGFYPPGLPPKKPTPFPYTLCPVNFTTTSQQTITAQIKI